MPIVNKSKIKHRKSKIERGFTLIEMIIVIAIFSAIIIISSSMLVIGYASGRTDSIAKGRMNSDIDVLSSILEQKMNNATARAVLGGNIVRGANYFDADKMLVIASYNPADPATTQCTFINFDATANKTITALQENCGAYHNSANGFEPLLSGETKLSGATINLVPSFTASGGPGGIKINLTFTDKSGTKFTTHLQNTYNINYQIYKGI